MENPNRRSTSSTHPKSERTKQIYFVLNGNKLERIVGDIPRHYQFSVIQYDIECADPAELTISPLDGEVCILTEV